MIARLVLLCLALAAWTPIASAAAPVRPLEERVERLERRVGSMDSLATAAVVSAVLCALWAQNTRRNAWLWFFLGLIFSLIALLALLYKNADDLKPRRAPA